MKNNLTTAKFITEKERAIIGRLSYEKAALVSLAQFDSYFGEYDKTARARLIYRLKKLGILKTVKKGLYVFSPLEAGAAGRNINEFLIAAALVPSGEYYIGYATMYNYYGLTDQIYQAVYVLNTAIQRDINAGRVRFKLLKIPKNRMYGIIENDISGARVRISGPERTLVDMLYFPAPVGGLKNAFRILVDKLKSRGIDRKKFLEYLCRFPSVYVRKRAGYILEQAGIKTGRLIETVNRLSLMTLYDNKSRKGSIDRKWGVIINDTQ